jgi:hypothetical protein
LKALHLQDANIYLRILQTFSFFLFSMHIEPLDITKSDKVVHALPRTRPGLHNRANALGLAILGIPLALPS